MKKLLQLSIVFLLLSCGNNADFKTVKMTMQVNDDPIIIKTFEGEFTKSIPDELGLVEITDSENRLKVSYYEESNPNQLRFLNIKFGQNRPGEWRANKGHKLIIIPKNDSLGFFFHDKNSLAGDVMGTLLFTK